MIDQLDIQIATWVFDHLHEIEWHEGATGGLVARLNGVAIVVSGSGLTLSDGIKSCKVILPSIPKKMMDVTDHYQKKLNNLILAIRAEATRQVIERTEDPNRHQKVKDELFKKLTGVW